MNKFKVGDRVKYIGAGYTGFTKGDIVTVAEYDGGSIPYRVKNENDELLWVCAGAIEAIKAPATTGPSRRLKYGRRRMAFEFAKALLSNPALERSYLDTPEAIAGVADKVALELIKRWKEVK